MKSPHKAKPLDQASAAGSSAAGAGCASGRSSQAASQAAAAAPAAPISWRLAILPPSLIVLASVAAYLSSFQGGFVFDDRYAIVDNPTIRQLWPIWPVLSPPCDGETVGGRPLLNLSLAINYALSGLEVWSYHVTNLVIHIGAAMLLFGIVRRTFLMPALRDRFGRAATPLALAGALLWTVHPLQTESVTYVIQRAESLMGFLYLLTLYCVIRGAGAGTVPFFAGGLSPFSPPGTPTLPSNVAGEKGDCPPSCSPLGQPRQRGRLGRHPEGTRRARCPRSMDWDRPLLWYAAAVLTCLLGMATKEVMVTAPVLVLLYDRMFLSGSWAEALRRRWGFYLGLSASWVLLAYLMFSTGLIARQSDIGAPDVWSYARTQPGVILHYLRLCFWPNPLCLSYGWQVANGLGEVLPGAILVGVLLAGTLWGLIRRKAWGFLGAWFFLILAPTSSFLPLMDVIYEHRMYLPLAAVAVLVVAGGYELWDRLLPRPACQRGRSPFSPARLLGRMGLWAAKKETVPAAKEGTVPGLATVMRWAAPVAALAVVLLALGYATAVRNLDYQSTIAIWQSMVDKRPRDFFARQNLANTLFQTGRTHEAIQHYQEALRLQPDNADIYNNLGAALANLGKTDEAIEHYQRALRLSGDYFLAHHNLGLVLASLGRSDEAIQHYQQALRVKPNYAEAHYNLANALTHLARYKEAMDHYREALRLKPRYPEAHHGLANVLATAGSAHEAIEHYREALRQKPDYAKAHNNLANVLAGMGKTDEAIQHYSEAVRLQPQYTDAHYNLATVLANLGRTDQAIEHYCEALRLKPDYADAHLALAGTLAAAGRTREAIAQYSQTLELLPDSRKILHKAAWLLATSEPAAGGDPDRAVRLAQRARELSGRENAECLDTLAAAYAAAGRFDDAVLMAERAVELANAAGQGPLARQIQVRLELYRAGQPYRVTK